MDVKYSENQKNGEAQEASLIAKKKSIFTFIQEMKAEMKKVSWTSKKELKFSTKMVILTTFVFGFAIYCVDLCVKGLLESIKASVHFIFG